MNINPACPFCGWAELDDLKWIPGYLICRDAEACRERDLIRWAASKISSENPTAGTAPATNKESNT